jgi:hypothetical protein
MRPSERRIASSAIGLMLLLLAGGTRWAQAKEPEAQQESSRRRTIRLQTGSETARLCYKSQNYTVARVDLKSCTVAECIDFLRQTSRELDTREADPARRGINFVNLLDPGTLQRAPRVNIRAENVSILDVLDEIVRQANLDYRIAPYVIEIGNPGDFTDPFPERHFDVPPAVFPECHSSFRKGSELADYVRSDVRQRLREWGYEIPSEGSAYYFPATFQLRVSGDSELLGSLDEKVKSLVARHSFPRRKQTAASEIPGAGSRFGGRPTGRIIATLAKLQRIIFPRVEMRSATVEEAFEFFFRKTTELDTMEPIEARKGIRGSLAPGILSSGAHPEITLSLQDIPAREALEYITKLAKLEYTVQEDGSVLIQARSDAPKLQKRTYYTPTEGINLDAGTIVGPDGVTYPSVQELFSAFGVSFPEGASASLSKDAEIVIRNTEPNLAVADVTVAVLIDSRERSFSKQQIADLRSIIADAQAHGQIRNPPTLGFGEG